MIEVQATVIEVQVTVIETCDRHQKLKAGKETSFGNHGAISFATCETFNSVSTWSAPCLPSCSFLCPFFILFSSFDLVLDLI